MPSEPRSSLNFKNSVLNMHFAHFMSTGLTKNTVFTFQNTIKWKNKYTQPEMQEKRLNQIYTKVVES